MVGIFMTVKVEPRKMGNYTIPEASKYIRAPYTTILSWVRGDPKYPIFQIDKKTNRSLSFLHLTELYLLNTIRKNHHIKPKNIHLAIKYLKQHATNEDERMYPLASKRIYVDADQRHIFVKELGLVVNASKSGQTTMHDLLGLVLRRIEFDEFGIPTRLYPFMGDEATPDSTKNIVIDPRVSFGRPVIRGTGAPISIVAERYQYGESEIRLSRDYKCSVKAIKEALRFELYSKPKY